MGFIHICWAMQGDDEVIAWCEIQRSPTGWRAQARQLLEQGVNHRIANEKDAIVRDTGAVQIVIGGLASGEEPVRDGVSYHPVYFLGHGPVACTYAAFHMC